MNDFLTVTGQQVRFAWKSLLLLVLLAAAINVPWALTMMRSRIGVSQIRVMVTDQPQTKWPASTPHEKPWPAPTYLEKGGAFGCHILRARASGSDSANVFSMEVQQAGWPIHVIEEKQMWGDWNNPELKGPEPDPQANLNYSGLLLNPVILGGGTWLILVFPYLMMSTLRKLLRAKHNQCIWCGYPTGVSNLCSECGKPRRLSTDRVQQSFPG